MLLLTCVEFQGSAEPETNSSLGKEFAQAQEREVYDARALSASIHKLWS
jgi:hypothetical protein